jgi:ArsR family transcriptional regulator, lead/cadmium/zinc/bismuth-responsive transcriptional repressor
MGRVVLPVRVAGRDVRRRQALRLIALTSSLLKQIRGDRRDQSLLVDLYKLLGNSTRLKILLSLREGELCVSDMAHVLQLSIPATSHLLKLLRNHGWIRVRNDGKMAYYELDNDEFRAALDGDLMLLKSRLG